MKQEGFEIVQGCQVEFDRRRGVLYVHGPNGLTLLRVSQIPAKETILDGDGRATRLIDVTDRRGHRRTRGDHAKEAGL